MALEVKILCNCGSKYKFDVEPLNGRMPGPVRCPVCSADGTEEGDRIIARLLTPAPVVVNNQAAQISPTPIAISAAPPIAGVPPAALPGSSRPPVGGQIPTAVPKSSAEYRALHQAGSATPPPLPVSNSAPVATAVRAVPASVSTSPAAATPGPVQAPAQTKPAKNVAVTLGAVGAIACALLGMVLFAILLLNARRAGYGAWGLGLGVGAAARFLARGGNKTLGFISGGAACIAILAAQFFAISHFNNKREEAINQVLDTEYQKEVVLAKKAIAAKTDEELKQVIAEDNSDDRIKVGPGEITEAAMSEFKKNRMPELRKIATGGLTKAKFKEEKQELFEDLVDIKFRFRHEFGFGTILFLFLGVGTAFRVASRP